MNETAKAAALSILNERFGHDSLVSIATLDGDKPSVRTVDALYADGAFYVVTYALSGKMQQISKNPAVGVCGEWFTGHGIGENIGHPRDEANAEIAARLRAAFSSWYDAGHVNEDDPNTCILRVRMTDGVLFNQGTRYDIDFEEESLS